jgi:hypothetical protein
MKEIEEFETEDKLKPFFKNSNPEMAPSDFTARLMVRINSEEKSRIHQDAGHRYLIPVATVLIALFLSVMVYAFPAGEGSSQQLLINKLLRDFRFPVIEMGTFHFLTPELTALALGLFIGLFILLILDKILSKMFYR